MTPAKCPKCGHNTKDPIVAEPTAEDKADFVRAFLTDSRFTKEYPLFNGAVKVMWATPVPSSRVPSK